MNKHKINVQKIESLQNDSKETLDLVVAAREIYNVGCIKAVLWFYNCGIAKDIVPPNAHVIKFLRDCGYSGFSWSRNPPDGYQLLTHACNCMREVAKKVGTELNKPITSKQAQAAVWYLQTCKGLLSRNHKRKFTPILLVDFLNLQRWNIPKLDKKIVDVERLEELALDLKSFLDSL